MLLGSDVLRVGVVACSYRLPLGRHFLLALDDDDDGAGGRFRFVLKSTAAGHSLPFM
jgi:hypothetical protein